MAKPKIDPHAMAAQYFSVKRIGESTDPKKMPPQVPVGIPNNPQNWQVNQAFDYVASNPYGDAPIPIHVAGANLISPTYPGVREALLRTNEDALFPNGQLPLAQPLTPLQQQPPMPPMPPAAMFHPGTGKPVGMMLPNTPLPPQMMPPGAMPPGAGGPPPKGAADREQLRQFGAPMRQGPPRGARMPAKPTED